MKKILHLQTLALLSGVQNFSLHLLQGLSGSEYKKVMASSVHGPLVAECGKLEIKHIPIRAMKRELGLHDLYAFLQILFILKCGKYDVVHTHTSKAGLLGRLAARLAKVPLVIHTSHGMPFQEGQSRLAYKLYMFLEKLGNKWCDYVVYVNDSDRIRSLELGLIRPEQAKTIYNAIPPDLSLNLGKINETRKLPPEGEVLIGSTLRFSRQKNVLDITRAAIAACKRCSRLKFALLGEGEDLQLCRAMVQSHGLSGRIMFPGWDKNIEPWLELFDAFILYSRWEAMPFSIIEAMQSGLPVIGSDIPSICELVDEETGYIVPLDDLVALEDLLVKLGEDFTQAYAKGKRGAEKIRQKSDYQTMVSAYEALYNTEVVR